VIPVFRGDVPAFDGRECFADITKGDHMRKMAALGFRADVIVHLAGLVDVALVADSNDPARCLPGQTSIEPLYTANVTGTANVVDLARASGAKKIVFASSQTVYGFGDQGRADETTALRPLEHYAVSKVCAERLLESTSQQDLSVVIVRFPGIYSPLRRNGVVHAMCRSAVRDGLITVRSDYPFPLDVLALEDVVPGIAKSLFYAGEKFEVFNLSSGTPCSLDLLAERIAGQLPGTRIEKIGVAQPTFEMSGARALRLLQWQALPFNVRVAEMISSLK
jgi:nucleoside-diphosphate-sugar epimerase